jgi:hypothetical protein
MIPEGLTHVTDSFAKDEAGELYYLNAENERWDKIADLSLAAEKSTNIYVRTVFKGGLTHEGDSIQIRSIGGRLQWIKSDKSGEEWRELTPGLARQLESVAVEDAQDEIDASVRAKRLEEEKKLKEIKIGWYQDVKGDLYQFDGTTWLGKIPSKDQIEKLEYLGN